MNMKPVFVLIAALSAFILTACGQEGATCPSKIMTLTGHPVYNFINLFGIDQKALEANEKEAREALGENYDGYLKYHEAMVEAGFDQHEALRVIGRDAKEIEIYIPNADYKKLWEENPHDLSKQGKSHLVTIEYEAIEVGDQIVNLATSFEAKLVDHEPTIRK
jgi:hypothetical protein